MKDVIRRKLTWVLLSAAVLPGICGAKDILVLDGKGHAETERFTVPAREGHVIGVIIQPERKFVENAAHVDFDMNEDRIRVRYVCPIAPGTELAYVTNCAWEGDCIEFFIRPDLSSPRYFQYCGNVAGAFRAFNYPMPGTSETGWMTGAKAEVLTGDRSYTIILTIPRTELFPTMLTDGDSFGISFVRNGPTGGGRSCWIKSCAGSTEIDAFGTAIWGGGDGYFRKRAAGVKAGLRRKFADGEKLAQAERALDSFAESAPRVVMDAATLEAVDAAFDGLESKFMDIAFAGLPLLVYQPQDVATDMMAPDSSTKVMKSLRIVAPRGTRQVTSFAVANRLGKWFLGQVKVFDGTKISPRFSRAETNVIARQFAISRGFPTYTQVGGRDWDVVEPLPMGTVLRLAPGECAPIYLELDTHGVSAGDYTCTLAIKKAVRGYETLRIPLEISIVDVDISAMPYDKACYTHLLNFGNRAKNAAFLVGQGYNVIGPKASPYPVRKADGSFGPQDFVQFDRSIDAMLEAGQDRSRIKLWVFLGFEFDWLNPKDEQGRYLARFSEGWKASVRNRLTALVAHAKEKYGIGRDRIIWYVVDEPDGDIDDPKMKSKISLCYHAAKFLKEVFPDIRTMTDPHPLFLSSKEGVKPIARLRECIDIIELHRPSITPAIRDNVRAAGFSETWTYMVVGKGTGAANYRNALWQNMRDGYREVCPFWHLDESAGWDMFDPSDSDRPGRYADYASVYVDHDMGTQLLSRRQLFYNQGCEEARLILCARRALKDDASRLARLEELVRSAADEGTTAALDAARMAILRMLVPEER